MNLWTCSKWILLLCFLLHIGNIYCFSENDYDYPLESFDYYDDEGEQGYFMKFDKCFCNISQIWNGKNCQDLTEIQYLSALTSLGLGTMHLNNESATVKNLECHGINLTFHSEDFQFINAQDIFHVPSDEIFLHGSFCLDFMKGSGQEIETFVKACIPYPELPLCCQIPSKCDKNLSVSITLGDDRYPVVVPNIKYMKDFECSIGEMKNKVSYETNSSEVALVMISGETHLVWNSPPPLNAPFAISENKYCIETKDNKKLAHFCYRDPITEEFEACKYSTCLRKCCPEGFHFSESHGSCHISNGTIFEPKFTSDSGKIVAYPNNLVMLSGYPWCQQNGLYELQSSTEFQRGFILMENGSIYDELANVTKPYSQFCLESFKLDSGETVNKALVCFQSLPKPKNMKECKNLRNVLYSTLSVISCSFLLITLVTYVSIPELYANLHGKSLLSHVSSLFCAYVCQIVISSGSSSLTMTGCRIFALFNQVSFLWAFFWLNVMCFDIWWTLKSMSPSPESGESSRQRFILYSMYAWGCPVIIGAVTAVMEFLPQLETNQNLILPGFGIRHCWFQDEKSTWLYFHGFTLILYVFNIIFFIHVAAILIISQKLTEVIVRDTRKQYKERVFLYLKLFVVMGITWICEVASFQEGTCEYWMVTDVINSLQGMFLFFIFMCNKKVFQKLQTRTAPVIRQMKGFFSKSIIPQNSSSVVNSANNSSASKMTTQTSQTSLASQTLESLRRLSTTGTNSPKVEFSLKKVGKVEFDIE